jgi:hypothetical protein
MDLASSHRPEPVAVDGAKPVDACAYPGSGAETAQFVALEEHAGATLLRALPPT